MGEIKNPILRIQNRNEYLSIKEFRRDKLLIKGSKFIATAIPVSSEEEAKVFLEKIKKEFYDATHNPYAYVISEGEVSKSSEDREPSGTAGRQILSAIRSQNLKDILVIVTRYFGGVKLGIGGLSKAYYESALKVLKNCIPVRKEHREELSMVFPKKYFDQVQKVLNREKVKVKKLAFGDKVRMEINFSQGVLSRLQDELK
ncbi:MAG: YigZ family protein, partial [candidate division Zixibacteria bacterium]|nr:YigZ family protein [candidate division Zixibacteria bacterium]